jgi:hypothetical protein
MRGAAPGGVVVDRARRIGAAPAAVVARHPEIAGPGPPPAGVEHRRRGLVEEELGRALQELGHALGDRLQVEGRLADPVGQRRAVQHDPGAREDLRLAVKRQVDTSIYLACLPPS